MAEMKRGSIREVALFAMLGAMIFAAKMAMAQFPNIEPVSLLVMLLAVCFGWKGLYAVYLYVLLEFAMWGIGLWSVCYLYVWLILFVLARRLRRMESPLGWADAPALKATLAKSIWKTTKTFKVLTLAPCVAYPRGAPS